MKRNRPPSARRQTAAAAMLLAVCAAMMWLTLAALLGLGLSACRTAYVPVPVSTEVKALRADSASRAVLRVDSFIQKDSVTVWRDADTVRILQTRWRDRVRIRTDTICTQRIDTVTRYIEKPVQIPAARDPAAGRGSGAIWAFVILAAIIIAVFWPAKRAADKIS